jgi:uncharacterized protein YkwD
MPPRHAGRFAAVLLVAAVSQLATLPAQAAPRHGCEGADARPGEASYAELGRATLCLVNRERRRRGLRTLRADWRLALAARRHAADMVRHSYFSHDSRSGARFSTRIARAGYLRGVASWRAGENIAWGAGRRSTPRRIARSWMDSSGHRANILTAGYRDLGVGVVAGAPVARRYDVEATYVHDFGVRR